MLCLTVVSVIKADGQPGTWAGDYAVCDQHAEALKQDPLHLGVRFSTSNRRLEREFARAMDFWATILDMDWHREDSRNCAIQVVDGSADLFESGQAARAQFPNARSFQGLIAFNPGFKLRHRELFLTAVHELGHILGLQHSNSPSSVMYFLLLDRPVFVDNADLSALATRHKLRNLAQLANMSAAGITGVGSSR